MVCQHGPEATQRFGGDPRSEHGNIALQIGADEISSPSLAQPVAGCNETFRKTTTCPEPIEFSVGDLARVQRLHFEIADTPGEALPGLREQINRGGSQQEEPSRSKAFPPPPVDQSAQDLEEAGKAVNLVEDHELVFMPLKVEFWISELCATGVGFEIEIRSEESRGGKGGGS